MVGANIKIARLARGLSLQELTQLLSDSGHPTTKATLSNYENGKYIPTQEFLSVLALHLNTSVDFFHKEADFTTDLRFFQKSEMVDRKQQYLEAFISVELERFRYIDNILGIKADWTPQKKKLYTIDSAEAIENLAYQFRTENSAGSHAIASVCDILERNGWHIFSVPAFCTEERSIAGYDAISGIPFILYKPEGYQDEMRLSLLRSVGYSMIEGLTKKETDLLVDRFARAVLFPENLVRYTFGNRRTTLTELELSTTKRMYGLGKKYLVERMYELGVIDIDLYNEYNSYISQSYDMVRSSGLQDDSNFFDMPTTYEMRVARAYSEGIINFKSTRNSHSGKQSK